MADVFKEEMVRLLSQTNNPGPMYEGWQNPENRADQKGPNGVYATPFDRQGGPEVAQAQLEMQARDILSRFTDSPATIDQAVAAMMQVMRGNNQSPADKSGGAPALEVNKGMQYGGGDAAYSAIAHGGLTVQEYLKYKAFRAAEDEETRKKGEEESRKRKEDEEKSEKAEKELAARLAPVIQATIDARVNQALSAYGITAPAAQSAAAQAPAVQQAAPAAPNYAGGWQGLPGVNVPPGMQAGAISPPGMQGALSADGMSPHQAKADHFLKVADAKLSAMTDPYRKGNAKQEMVRLYNGILSGTAVHIDDPFLQAIAVEAGVQYYDMSGGLGQSL